MAFDSKKNFMFDFWGVIGSGDIVLTPFIPVDQWPSPPFNLVVVENGNFPGFVPTEIIRVTGIDGNAFNVLRAQEGTTALSFSNAWVILAPTVKTFTDIEDLLEAHKARHQNGGADAIKLDALAPPDDTTNLDVSAAAHGLVPKAPNDTAKYLRGDGKWAELPAVSSGLNWFEIEWYS